MNDKALADVRRETERFLMRLDELMACQKPVAASEQGFPYWTKRHQHSGSCPETAAIRRASMDLTRALARLRRY